MVDLFFSVPVAAGLSGLALLAIAVLLRRNTSRRVVLALSLLLYGRYILWRLLYTLPTDDLPSLLVGGAVFLAELYGFFQFCFFTFQSWSPTDRRPAPITRYPTVDIMVTVVDEPLTLLRHTLLGCLAQAYPADKFRIHVLDDGHRADAQRLAAALGCGYLRRPDRPRHAKAGNLNHALRHTSGELVAVFDVDHVPARTFLTETVGFFDDPRVAIVQTPHHFYNPDIFQRNLRVGGQVMNEQALFFRALQAGRDAHNSAFFAGSGGLFRRKPLEEIGGFQTQTITEDIHTSMELHAKGYRSCYLNRVLSAGLMPETFEGYLKQRKRWAMGCIQVLLRDNPLTKRGLTLAQRLDYFGSIFYFFFGVPRLICLTAPLASLLFGIPPLKADPAPLTFHFLSFFLASAWVMRPASRGSRNPFWSDVYEIAMCFALSFVALKALVAPRKERPFEVTPKGQRILKSTVSELSLVWPHLIVLGLLAAGLVLGARRLYLGAGDAGLPVSLLWGGVNLLLLGIATFVASEQPQGRRAFRLQRDFAGELLVDGDGIPARVLNLSEDGAAVVLPQPVLTAASSISLLLISPRGAPMRLTGRVVRQRRLPDGTVQTGLQFVNLDEATRRALADKMFGDAADWENDYRVQPGVAGSLRSLVRALTAPWRSFAWERRRTLRMPAGARCRWRTPEQLLIGRLEDMSFTGVSARFASAPNGALAGSLLELHQMTLKVSPVAIVRRWGHTRVRFRVESIEQGADRWRVWHEARWRST
ncbi:glycosyltransferase family 2 protein [Nitrospira moscoviensis]|uniref:glycosyltransferase family 2 protein n=1 Tax=Nitrospira moscoviensis TaxID=42253 RepID=UPI0011AE32DD|nr:glycosyltransferase [Nitrospira moscoviensis]